MNFSDTQFGVQIENSVGGLFVPLKSGEECCEDSTLLPESHGEQIEDYCAGSKPSEKDSEHPNIVMQLAESMGDKPKHQPRFVVPKTLEALSFESEQAQAGKTDNTNKFYDCQPDYEVAVTKTEGNCCLFSITPTDANNHQGSGNTGSSRKRRRALLQTLLEGEDATDGGETCKKRRSRWCDDASQLKMLGPIKLPDFVTDVDNCLRVDPEVQALNIKLVELNKKLRGSRHVDDLPDKKRSLAKRMNSRMRYHNRLLEKKRREIISRLVRKNPTFRPQPTVKPPKFQRKLYIPVKEYPDYNFIGPIIGPYGYNQKRMERETGAHIVVRGKGFFKGGKGQKHEPKRGSVDNEDLHVLVEADNEGSVDAAVKLVEQFLVPVGGLKDSSILDPGTEGSAFGASFPSETTQTKLGENMHVENLSVDSDSVHEENLFVAYLPQSVDEGGLMKMFSPFGTVVHVRVARDPTTGLSKCYGFVKFSDQFSAARAAECMNGQEMDGKMLTVKIRRSPKPFFCPGSCPGISSTADKGLRHCSWPIPSETILLPQSSSNRSHCYSGESGPYIFTKQHKYDSQIRDETLQDTLINLQPQEHHGPF